MRNWIHYFVWLSLALPGFHTFSTYTNHNNRSGRGHVRLGCHSHWVNNKPPTYFVAYCRGVTRSLTLAKVHENDTEVNRDDTDEPNENNFAGGFLVRNGRLLV